LQIEPIFSRSMTVMPPAVLFVATNVYEDRDDRFSRRNEAAGGDEPMRDPRPRREETKIA
jgi:hypothetical protein